MTTDRKAQLRAASATYAKNRRAAGDKKLTVWASAETLDHLRRGKALHKSDETTIAEALKALAGTLP